jgi:hypothetical protein
MVSTANAIFRDFVTDGVPASGPHGPRKVEIREWGAWLETAVNAGLSNGGLIYDTKASMNADLAHAANASAWVIGDATAANNGIYRKTGASGSGVWIRVGDLPYSIVYAQNDGSGTANAVKVTASVPIATTPYKQLISVPFTGTNDGAMTLEINGDKRALVTNTGQPIIAGYVKAGMAALVQIDHAGNYRLFTYGDATASQAAAEAAQVAAENAQHDAATAKVAAEAARDIAVNAASDAVSQGNVPIYATIAGMPAITVPAGINTIQVNGRNAPGDGKGGQFIVANNGSADTFTSADGRTWYRSQDVSSSLRVKRDRLVDAPEIVQKLQLIPQFGWIKDATTNTELYSGAWRASQGFDIYRKPSDQSIRRAVIMQKRSGASWAVNEISRLSEWDLDGDGATPIAVSPDLLVGHGGDCSVVIEGGKVYVYSTMTAEAGHVDTDAGRGWSKTEWKGAATTQADVQNFQVIGYNGSGHQYEDLNRAAVSACDEYVMMSFPSPSGDNMIVHIYERAKTEALADKLKAQPKYRWPLKNPKSQDGWIMQGHQMRDGVIMVTYGSTAVFGQHTQQFYDYQGNLLRELFVDGPRAKYTRATLLNHPTLGFPGRFEPEGCTMFEGEAFYVVNEAWVQTADVRTFEGKNFAYSWGNGESGSPARDWTKWVETTKASGGAWSSAETVTNSSAGLSYFSYIAKNIYSIRIPKGEVGEQPIFNGILAQPSLSQSNLAAFVHNASVMRGRSLTISAYSESLGTHKNLLDFATTAAFSFYDARDDADNTKYVNMFADFRGTSEILGFRAKNGSISLGAGLNLYGNSDTSSGTPGGVRTYTNGKKRMQQDMSGVTRFFADSGSVPLVAVRADDGMFLSLEKAEGTSLWGIYRGTGSPEGVVTAPRGSLYIVATGATSTLYVKDSGAGNTGWKGVAYVP